MNPKSLKQVEQELATAIGKRRLASGSQDVLDEGVEEVDEAGLELAQKALDACFAIGAYCEMEKKKTVQRLKDKGIRVGNEGSHTTPRPMQIHSFNLKVEPADLDRAMDVFAQQGFLHWGPKSAGGWQLYKRFNHAIDLIKTDEVTTRLIVRWGEPVSANKLSRIVRPSAVDMLWADLPSGMWPLYYLLRPFRIVADRLQGRNWPVLGPFLGTPIDLIEPMLDFAHVTENDVLFDLGCGDGRIMREAARLRGCKAVGIEQNEELIEIGRKEVTAEGLSELVQFVHGDASVAPLDEASVVFLFLPTTAVRELLPKIRSQLKSGSRIVAHEQRPIDVGISPDRSVPIITPTAVTVAHIWEVGDN